MHSANFINAMRIKAGSPRTSAAEALFTPAIINNVNSIRIIE
jgi:hypothetical protein